MYAKILSFSKRKSLTIGAPRSSGRVFDQAAMAFVEEIHLRAKCCAGLLLIKIGEKRIVVAIGDSPRVQLFGQYFGER